MILNTTCRRLLLSGRRVCKERTSVPEPMSQWFGVALAAAAGWALRQWRFAGKEAYVYVLVPAK